MRTTVRVTTLLFRRSLAAKLVLPLIVAGCWMVLYAQDPSWVGRWLDTALTVQAFAVIVAGPAIAAATGWDLARARQRDELGASAALRSHAAESALRLVAATAWGAVVLLSVAFAASLRTALASEWGIPSIWVVLLGLAAMIMETALALILATLIPTVASVVVFLVACQSLIFVHTRGELQAGPRRAFPLVTETWDPWSVPLVGRIAVVLIWCVGVSLLLVWLSGLRTKRTASVSGGVIALVCSALALTVLVGFKPRGDSLLATLRPPGEHVCRESEDVRVCVWRGDEFQLPVLVAGYARAHQATSGALDLPRQLIEQGLDKDLAGSAEFTNFVYAVPPRSAETVTADLIDRSVPSPGDSCLELMNVSELGDYPLDFAVRALLRQRAGFTVSDATDDPVSHAITPLVKAPRAAQDAWLRVAVEALETCAPAPPIPTAPS